jgi:hypothetical protein
MRGRCEDQQPVATLQALIQVFADVAHQQRRVRFVQLDRVAGRSYRLERCLPGGHFCLVAT